MPIAPRAPLAAASLQALTSCARTLVWSSCGAFLILLPTAGCGGNGHAQSAPDAEQIDRSAARTMLEARPKVAIAPQVHERVAKMMRELEPLDPTLTSDYHDRHFIAGQRMMEEMTSGSTELGLAAMLAYADYGGENVGISRALLSVAAHCAPEDSRELLAHLMLEYGYPISDRTEAALLLAETSPETYLELARPFVVRHERLSQTMPDDEFLVRGWAIACEETDRSPVPELADVLMNLMMQDAARHFAAQKLGEHPDPLGQSALEMAMIESSGNGYLRRKAAQAIAKSVPRETACELFREVLGKEADYNFATFLRSMIDLHCAK